MILILTKWKWDAAVPAKLNHFVTGIFQLFDKILGPMKLLLPGLFLLLVIIASSCSTPIYDAQTLQELPRQEPSPLELTASFELFDWRYDIIRQEECEEDMDGDTYYEDVDYHPIGFDLGNGLFFDLNNNLSLRIDRLLGIDYSDGGDHAQLTYQSTRFLPVRELDLTPDQLLTRVMKASGQSRNFRTTYSVTEQEVTRAIRNRQEQTILEFSEEGFRFYRRRGNYHSIEEVAPGRYQRFRNKGRQMGDPYDLSQEEISLPGNYVIRIGHTRDRIEIFERNRNDRRTLLHTIQLSPDRIVVYRPSRVGFTITFDKQGFTYRHSSGLQERYSHRL